MRVSLDIRAGHVLCFGIGVLAAGISGIIGLSINFDDGDPFVYWPALVGGALTLGSLSWMAVRRLRVRPILPGAA